MGFRKLFFIVAEGLITGLLLYWYLWGAQIHGPGAPAQPPPAPSGPGLEVRIAPPAHAELPPPRLPKPPLAMRLAQAGFKLGDPVFVRIFKYENELEVWIKRDERFQLFDRFPICYFSGDPGPKEKEGDGQSPEGFYEVGAKQLNPNSAYHLSFNLGYPNAYDAKLKRTGSALMVHGACASIGCYAMTDYGITEIYALVSSALFNGQRSVSVHAFPFRMTNGAMAVVAGNPWEDFWVNLKEGYDAFEKTRVPPRVFVCGERYAFAQAGQTVTAACDRVAAW